MSCRQSGPARLRAAAFAGVALLGSSVASAVDAAGAARSFKPDMGKLLATGGVSQVEGAGGGGLTPWALITGYGSRDSYGANLHATAVQTRDYALYTNGIALGLLDRFEVSLAQQEFRGSLAPLDQLRLRQDIVGLKWRFAGDAVYEQDSALPQLAVGVQYKHHRGVSGLQALGVSHVKQLGALDDNGVDVYLSATKLLLEYSLLANLTLRSTRANQMGLLGFGGDKENRRRIMAEASIAYLFDPKWVAGIEYRQKPQNLSLDKEKAYADLFVAWFPNKHLSLTAAWVDLGDITVFNPKRQRGWYLSAQVGF